MMKYIQRFEWVALLLWAISFNAWSLSFVEAQTIYNKLTKANGMNVAPKLVLRVNQEVNAKYMGSIITVNLGMLNFVRNSHELAVVLGHELGHYIKRHNGSTPKREYVADQLSKQIASRAGYDACKGVYVYFRLHTRESKTHPDSNSRYKRVKCS